ncbi:major facilitator superfamily domain-containing protein 6-like [Argiope bruennichi]|uniref:Major facilitator superfamily like protein n=1 Tax=Argiope bruennichi TaxID=94029 RepID=A0A8T0E6C4_ARGBR|nr:major facilitator superfamily domain-containing protein 6-like [Argiope bruennichi]XP_055937239.1 major facilitator superfamily domain-containing protein 6-like [Argiope bruennichi]XP_055937240.1 major facilitator superfamily domain-containing protein 6-like [Argiope bruennichi]XP_055937241.1 major facilitator superfamily domain-containing protein 6-like [Argiope bruennichi]KAF8766472.1 Major facilitator superfamily like protein [Argiope bruennichi]
MAEKKTCQVNMRLLPIKAHYFFFFGAMGGVMPFMPVLAKNLGISSTAVGLVYTVLPFCVFFSKPLFGFITDLFRNIKLIVFLLVCATSVGYFSVIFLPPIDNVKWTHVDAQCQNTGKSISVIPNQYDNRCLRDVLKQSVNGELSFMTCDNSSSLVLQGKVSIGKFVNTTTDEFAGSNDTFWLEFIPDLNISCECIKNDSSALKSVKMSSCLPGDNSLVYKTYQFWVFTVLVVIGGTGSATVFCLSDAACYEVLGERPELYGRQRLWATISWGCVTLLAGFFNDIATGNSDTTNYAPGFYLMLALVAVDILLLLKIKLTKANFSLHICQDIGQIFSSCHTVAFATCVYIIGGLTGLIWNYQFWFLEDLGATQTLMGLCVAVQCLVAEMPFFFFAGWFIKTFGYFTCIIGSFIAFTLRLGLYYILENPWLILPVEILHGLTFAVFYASMTGYASDNAPPGTEATMMGILGGLFEGLGVATGSLLGGVGFDKIGGRWTFLVAATISFFCAPSLALVLFILKRLRPKS